MATGSWHCHCSCLHPVRAFLLVRSGDDCNGALRGMMTEPAHHYLEMLISVPNRCDEEAGSTMLANSRQRAEARLTRRNRGATNGALGKHRSKVDNDLVANTNCMGQQDRSDHERVGTMLVDRSTQCVHHVVVVVIHVADDHAPWPSREEVANSHRQRVDDSGRASTEIQVRGDRATTVRQPSPAGIKCS
jgi:hypothetical protein